MKLKRTTIHVPRPTTRHMLYDVKSLLPKGEADGRLEARGGVQCYLAIITAYVPTLAKWETDLKTRKQR